MSMPRALRDPDRPAYLRIGDWDGGRPFSSNFALGTIEVGLSVYDLDGQGFPVIPDGEWAAVDLADRLRSDAPKHLVQGLLVGEGHDGEPLLAAAVIVGEWRP